MKRTSATEKRLRALASLTTMGAAVIGLSCTENLPMGPSTFTGITLKYLTAHDTTVVGDTSLATAKVTDAGGNVIQGLTLTWTAADQSVVGLATPATDDGAAGRTQSFIGRKPGQTLVSMSLPDARFVSSATSRLQTVVVGGVRTLSSRDTTLTAINDTGRAIAAGLVKQNGALVTRVSQGIRWTRKGSHTTIVGQGDTIRYIAQSNGVDTLISSADFCLAGAKCADTTIVRVAQQLALTLSSRNFLVWSLRDSIAPTITLADRRGNGLAGTSIRFSPVGAADAAVVAITPVLGASNPTTGLMATPRAVSIGNGPARVTVQAIGSDGSVIASDEFAVTVRQVARRAAVEPLRSVVTVVDSIPVLPLARDARGAVIADATVVANTVGLNLHGIWVGPHTTASVGAQGTLTPVVSGIALPESNPLAPQIPVVLDQSVISLVGVDTVLATATTKVYSFTVLDSTAAPAVGTWVRLRATGGGIVPDSVQVNGAGVATVTWTPSTTASDQTLTAVRSAPSLLTPSDSAGRIVMRRTVTVVAGLPDATLSNTGASAATVPVNGTATVTVVVRDIFGNLVLTATPAAFSATATRGSLGAFACVGGVCSATYTAPATSGPDAVSVLINGVAVQGSPITITIP